MKIAYSALYSHPLPENHRFPMLKYELVPQQLIYEGTVITSQFIEPQAILYDDLILTHSSTYISNLKLGRMSAKEMRKIGFPYSKQLVDREEKITQGTIDVSIEAFKHGIGFNIAGGTHHAFEDSGEGFCIYNDIACATNFLLKNKPAGIPTQDDESGDTSLFDQVKNYIRITYEKPGEVYLGHI